MSRASTPSSLRTSCHLYTHTGGKVKSGACAAEAGKGPHASLWRLAAISAAARDRAAADQAGSWDKPRRVVAKIERHKGEWFPRVGFLVTNLRRPSWRVVKFYNGRGTARPEADGARKDPKPPRKSLTNPRDKEILALDAPGRSWEYPLGEMSEERDLDCIGEVSCRVAG